MNYETQQSDRKKTDKSNWQRTNIGMMVIAFLIFMPFGLVLLAMLTLGRNINLLGMFKDFWRRMTKGASFKQPDLWASATDNYKAQNYNHDNAAFNQYRQQRDANFDETDKAAFAKMAEEEKAFNEYQGFKQAAEEKAKFAQFKAWEENKD
ncbi:MAG: DUF2852 domain-containing protein [Rhizobiales bacterium]|nr:DUF2852 domain-containing protein [Hyphomicrobiales bacterium]NRB13615.1 DUF2852 domain-containing protein [Hyphomicrobiales bacterium]